MDLYKGSVVSLRKFCSCLKFSGMSSTGKSSHVECLKRLKMFSIFFQLPRTDLIVPWKLVHGDVDCDLGFVFARSHARTHWIGHFEIKKNNKFKLDEHFERNVLPTFYEKNQ